MGPWSRGRLMKGALKAKSIKTSSNPKSFPCTRTLPAPLREVPLFVQCASHPPPNPILYHSAQATFQLCQMLGSLMSACSPLRILYPLPLPLPHSGAQALSIKNKHLLKRLSRLDLCVFFSTFISIIT